MGEEKKKTDKGTDREIKARTKRSEEVDVLSLSHKMTKTHLSNTGEEWMSAKERKTVYLGQYVVNLRIHQSSSVSVLGYTKNLGTNLKMRNKKREKNVGKKFNLQLRVKICFWEVFLDAHLRQRGCGYVHVTPRRHRQQ